MTSLVEVLDSAVKIGLGALITGVVTYWNTKSKNQIDLQKAVLDERRSLLRSASAEIAKALDTLDDYTHITHVTPADSVPSALGEKASLLIETHKAISRAQALVALVGIETVTAEVGLLRKLTEELHRMLAPLADGAQYDEASTIQLVLQIEQQTASTYAAMAAAYRQTDA